MRNARWDLCFRIFLGPSELHDVYKQWLSLLPIDTCKNNSMNGMEGMGEYFDGCT